MKEKEALTILPNNQFVNFVVVVVVVADRKRTEAVADIETVFEVDSFADSQVEDKHPLEGILHKDNLNMIQMNPHIHIHIKIQNN
jgi:hypothetical protein